MTRKDWAALTAAMKLARQDPMRAQQLDGKLASGEPWEEVAEFAAYCMQCDNLRLKPWQAPPLDTADATDERESYGHMPNEVALKRKMIALGISLYAPDPMKAIAAIEAKTPA